MGLRNLIMGDYYCAQAHAHSSDSEVDRCNQLYRQKNTQDNEKEIELARIRTDEHREEQRTLQMKYQAEAALNIRIAQLSAANNLVFQPQIHPNYHSSGTQTDNADNRITPYMAGNSGYGSPYAQPRNAHTPFNASNGHDYCSSYSSSRYGAQTPANIPALPWHDTVQ